MNKKLRFLVFLSISCVLNACSENEISREDEIRLYIEKGVEAAEDRSAGDVADLIHDSYNDEQKLDKTQIKKILRLYFFRHKNIFLFTKIRDIKFPSENEASVTLHVAMAGSVISDASMLSSVRARMYKFDLQLIKSEQWLLQKARWKAVSSID